MLLPNIIDLKIPDSKPIKNINICYFSFEKNMITMIII